MTNVINSNPSGQGPGTGVPPVYENPYRNTVPFSPAGYPLTFAQGWWPMPWFLSEDDVQRIADAVVKKLKGDE